jgi:hypothetical protein
MVWIRTFQKNRQPCIPCAKTRGDLNSSVTRGDVYGAAEALQHGMALAYAKARGRDLEAMQRSYELTQRARAIGREKQLYGRF